jgi:putative ABC transport system substrate-binding protein
MNRRELIAGLGGAAAWPAVALSQRGIPVVGVLHSSTLTEARRPHIGAFHLGLAETGYVEGRDVALEYAGRRTATTGCLNSLLSWCGGR